MRVDTTNYNVNLYHFAYALNKPTSNVLFWAVTRVEVPHEMRNVRLAIGSNAASIWWLNGQEVIGIYGDRQTVIDDGVSKRVTLTKGLNTIRAAVINAGGATDFCARFLDADDNPVKGDFGAIEPGAALNPAIGRLRQPAPSSSAPARATWSACAARARSAPARPSRPPLRENGLRHGTIWLPAPDRSSGISESSAAPCPPN